MRKILVALGAFALLGAAVAYYRHKFLEYFTPVVDDPTDDDGELGDVYEDQFAVVDHDARIRGL